MPNSNAGWPLSVAGDGRWFATTHWSTVAYLDRPDNPKEARFSEREYGRFGSYFEYTIEKDKPLTVNYRLWVQDGLMKPEDVASLSTDFLEPVKVTVRESH